MSHHDYDDNEALNESIQIEGKITDIFGHRFVITDAMGKKVLADIGKHNQERVKLEMGASVTASGKMKPSELKIRSLSVNGVAVALPPKDEDNDDRKEPQARPEDMNRVIQTAEDKGLTVIGQRVHPKHAEILGMSQDNELTEMHIGFDGSVRKSEQVAPDSQKWAKELAAA